MPNWYSNWLTDENDLLTMAEIELAHCDMFAIIDGVEIRSYPTFLC